MDKKKLIKAYKRVENDIVRLWHSQTELSRAASVFYGKNVDAEICAGGEIEFRLIGEDEIPDSDNTIRLEDILNKK